MDKDKILKLLQHINEHHYVGAMTIDVLLYALDNELLERTINGNFELSPKGADFLNGNIDIDMC